MKASRDIIYKKSIVYSLSCNCTTNLNWILHGFDLYSEFYKFFTIKVAQVWRHQGSQYTLFVGVLQIMEKESVVAGYLNQTMPENCIDMLQENWTEVWLIVQLLTILIFFSGTTYTPIWYMSSKYGTYYFYQW